MDGIAGVEIQSALKKAATWGTPVVCGANDGLLLLPGSISREDGVEVDDSQGKAHSTDGDRGFVKVEGDRPLYARYDGLDVFEALVMGSAGLPTQQGVTAAYAYVYDWADKVDGLFGTFVRKMVSYIEELTTMKVIGFTFKGEIGKPLQYIFHVVAIDKVTDSTVNTTTTFNNVTFFENSNRILFSHGVFRMNDQSNIALAAGDQIYPNSFEISVKRKLKGEYTGEYRTSNPAVQDLVDEPLNDGQPEIRLKLSFPRHSSPAYMQDLGNDTRKKFDMNFTGGLIEATYYRQKKYEFPHLQLLNVDPTDEQGIIKEPLEFVVHGADSAPAGMNFTTPFRISGINRRTTDPLA